jgi:hypothetical protein
MKLRLTSDGTPNGFRIETENGERIEWITRATIDIDANNQIGGIADCVLYLKVIVGNVDATANLKNLIVKYSLPHWYLISTDTKLMILRIADRISRVLCAIKYPSFRRKK